MTAETGVCFVSSPNGRRVLAPRSVSLLLTCSVSLSYVMCLWQGIIWDAFLLPFDLLYILLCTPLSFENKMLCECLAGSFSFTDLFFFLLFYDFKEVSLGPTLLSVLNIDLRVTPSRCCTQTSWLSKFTHRTQSIPNSETPCLLCHPLPPPPSNFKSKL